jgi:hypothetical protein
LGPGQTTTVIGSDTPADSTLVTFATPVTAFSIELYNAAGAQKITVEAFDAGDVSIGAVSATPPSMDSPVFLGVVSGNVIVRLEITAAKGSRELLDNLRFGQVIGPE